MDNQSMITDANDAMTFGEQVGRSARLRLRPVQEDELVLLERWWNCEALLPHQAGNVIPRPDGGRIEEFQRWYSNTDPAHVGFAVERLVDGELLGAAVLYGATYAAPAATFAIQLRPDVLGHGYGTEATRLIVDYGFRALPLHRIELRVYAFNDRAIRCYRSAGFVEEGTRRQVVFLDGQWHDELIMSVVRPDWDLAH